MLGSCHLETLFKLLALQCQSLCSAEYSAKSRETSCAKTGLQIIIWQRYWPDVRFEQCLSVFCLSDMSHFNSIFNLIPRPLEYPSAYRPRDTPGVSENPMRSIPVTRNTTYNIPLCQTSCPLRTLVSPVCVSVCVRTTAAFKLYIQIQNLSVAPLLSVFVWHEISVMQSINEGNLSLQGQCCKSHYFARQWQIICLQFLSLSQLMHF